ncbi:MAG: GNAT family N-acetyltransferase [Dehalococcoidia bacterium]
MPNGFDSRPLTLDDVPEIVRVANTWSERYSGRPEVTEEQERGSISNPRVKLEQDTHGVFTADGSMAGLVEFYDLDDPHTNYFGFLRALPDENEAAILRYLVRWCLARAKDSIPSAPADARCSFNVGTLSQDETMRRVLLDEGLSVDRYSWQLDIVMDSPPPAPIWLEGIELRPFDPDTQARDVWEADEEAFQDHYGHVTGNFETWWSFVTDTGEMQPERWYIPWEGDQIAGVCLCTVGREGDPNFGWVNDLAVRRPWRKKGLGLALLHHAFGEFYRQGIKKVGLSADSQNLTGAIRLYERAGMSMVRQFDSYEIELRPGRDMRTTALST